jgi:hypothetical protein
MPEDRSTTGDMSDRASPCHQRTPRLAAMFDAWDAGIVGEEPLARHRWTDLALWPAARGATVSGSTGIEGNPLGAVEVEAVLAGGSSNLRPGVRPADIRDVLNYNRALDLVNRAARRRTSNGHRSSSAGSTLRC